MTALVEPPSESTVVTASRNARRSAIFEIVRFSRTISTIRAPLAAAMRWWAESTAGMEDAPGSVIPSASAAAVIVDAVPMVMHCPGERAERGLEGAPLGFAQRPGAPFVPVAPHVGATAQ